jgi:hypothetical protein
MNGLEVCKSGHSVTTYSSFNMCLPKESLAIDVLAMNPVEGLELFGTESR